MKTIELAWGYGVSLQYARFLTEEEKSHYIPEVRDCMLICTGNTVDLPNVSFCDVPKDITCRTSFSFPSCSNAAYEITDDEWEFFVSLERRRAEEKKAKEIERQIEYWKQIIKMAEAQQDIPSREEVKKRLKIYNDTYNEGGEGFLPYIVSREEYESAKAFLAEMHVE